MIEHDADYYAAGLETARDEIEELREAVAKWRALAEEMGEMLEGLHTNYARAALARLDELRQAEAGERE